MEIIKKENRKTIEKDQWNKNLILCKDQQNWQAFRQNDQDTEIRFKLLESEMKEGTYYWPYRYEKGLYKWITWNVACHYIR